MTMIEILEIKFLFRTMANCTSMTKLGGMLASTLESTLKHIM